MKKSFKIWKEARDWQQVPDIINQHLDNLHHIGNYISNHISPGHLFKDIEGLTGIASEYAKDTTGNHWHQAQMILGKLHNLHDMLNHLSTYMNDESSQMHWARNDQEKEQIRISVQSKIRNTLQVFHEFMAAVQEGFKKLQGPRVPYDMSAEAPVRQQLSFDQAAQPYDSGRRQHL